MRKAILAALCFAAACSVAACSGLTVKATYQYPPAEDRK
jgi:hypothetical protein